jgi:ribosome-associated toxin RatA of RatAB toxin-antitoxin module
MTDLEFTINLSSPKDQLMNVITDYEKYVTYLPDQLKNVEIIERNENVTITEESIIFSNYIKKPFLQKTKHILKNSYMHESILISGPAEGSSITVDLKNNNEDGTQVDIKIKLKLSWKAKFLLPLIKKWYRRVITTLLYNINNLAEMRKNENV